MAWSDFFGKSSAQIGDAYQNDVRDALSSFNDAWAVNEGVLESAMSRPDGTMRTLGSALGDYDIANANIANALANNANAGMRTQDYLNPYSNYINRNVVDAVQGSAGAAIQGSGTSNAIAKGVADASSQQWNVANQQSLADSSNNQNILNAMQRQSENVLTADASPQQDYLNMNKDWATEQLKARTNLATQKANTDSQDKGIIGGFINTIGNFF